MATRAELKKIATTRLKEAKVLYDSGYFDGAVYLCGYVTEAALKARICRNLVINEYKVTSQNHQKSFYSHDFDYLLLLGGLQKEITLANPQGVNLFMNWSLLTQWKPDLRYEAIGTYDRNYAKEVIRALEDPNDGFLTWIKRRW